MVKTAYETQPCSEESITQVKFTTIANFRMWSSMEQLILFSGKQDPVRRKMVTVNRSAYPRIRQAGFVNVVLAILWKLMKYLVPQVCQETKQQSVECLSV